jgi:hypothetical protein
VNKYLLPLTVVIITAALTYGLCEITKTQAKAAEPTGKAAETPIKEKLTPEPDYCYIMITPTNVYVARSVTILPGGGLRCKLWKGDEVFEYRSARFKKISIHRIDQTLMELSNGIGLKGDD